MNDKFLGTWKCVEDDSSVRITVSTDASGTIHIHAVDSSDDEVLDISNIEASQDRLSFRCVVPSTGYRTENQMILNDDGSCEYRLTLFEKWQKLRSDN